MYKGQLISPRLYEPVMGHPECEKQGIEVVEEASGRVCIFLPIKGGFGEGGWSNLEGSNSMSMYYVCNTGPDSSDDDAPGIDD
jgi:hypothetical protein